MIVVVFCSDPFDHRHPDPVYAAEVEAARAAGFQVVLVSFEDITASKVQAAIRYVPQMDFEQLAVYRGWMLQPHEYKVLYDALLVRALRLINTPDEYTFCHHLPNSYPAIKGLTPVTVWLLLEYGQKVDFDSVMGLLRELDGSSVVLKDYAKSQKHYWTEACFIPDHTNRMQVEKVVGRFLELQGTDLSGGLVFREFIPLVPLANQAESSMPMSEEYRVFFLGGSPLYTVGYWEQGEYPTGTPPVAQYLDAAQRVQSRFFTMDIVQCQDGTWIIVELGDAQVAGLPERARSLDFYIALAEHLRVQSKST